MRILFHWKKNPTSVESQNIFSQSLNIFFFQFQLASATQVRTTTLFFFILLLYTTKMLIALKSLL